LAASFRNGKQPGDLGRRTALWPQDQLVNDVADDVPTASEQNGSAANPQHRDQNWHVSFLLCCHGWNNSAARENVPGFAEQYQRKISQLKGTNPRGAGKNSAGRLVGPLEAPRPRNRGASTLTAGTQMFSGYFGGVGAALRRRAKLTRKGSG
jgi:hypothetical protein